MCGQPESTIHRQIKAITLGARIFSRALYSFIPLAVWQLFRSKSQNSSDNSFNTQSAHPFNPEVVGSFDSYKELYSSH